MPWALSVSEALGSLSAVDFLPRQMHPICREFTAACEDAVIDLKNIYSLSDFQRKTREHIRRLKRSGRPEVLTVNGKAELVVQDAESYQDLLDALDRAEAIAGIRRGLDSMEKGEGKPASEVLAGIRKRHKIPPSS